MERAGAAAACESGGSVRERRHTELRRLAQHASGKTVERVEELAAHVAEQRDLVVVHRHGVTHECKDHARVADEVGHEEINRDHRAAGLCRRPREREVLCLGRIFCYSPLLSLS